jgi:hypothetical protein
MTVFEQLKVEKVKVSLKECLLNYRTYYLAEFQRRWSRKIPATVVVLAMKELERENFLTIGSGRNGATLLRLKEQV